MSRAVPALLMRRVRRHGRRDRQGMSPLWARARLDNQEEVSRLRAKHLEHLDPEVLATFFDQGRMNQGYDAHVLLPAIRCPVLLLQADPEASGLTPHEEIAPALALLPRGKHVFLKGVSHARLHDQPE